MDESCWLTTRHNQKYDALVTLQIKNSSSQVSSLHYPLFFQRALTTSLSETRKKQNLGFSFLNETIEEGLVR